MLERFLTPFALSLGAWMTYALWSVRNRGNAMARPGTVFVCHVCGKRSHDRNGTMAVDGWDTSCRTWAQLCSESSIVLGADGRVSHAVTA